MFHTLLDVQQYIDNRDGHLYIDLKSITFAVGWYNIEKGETFSWRNTGGLEETLNIPPGLYGFDRLKEVLEGVSSSPTHTLKVSRVNGLITLTVASERGVLLSDGLLTLLGLDDGLGGVWLDAGVYTGDRPVNFATGQMLWIHLEEINTDENIVDGAPSTLLTSIGLGCHAFGDINTVRMECPEYKRLRDGTVGELKVSIRDASRKAISNQDLPIHVTLAVIKKMGIFGEGVCCGPNIDEVNEILSGYAKTDYVDVQDGLRVLKAGDTMSGDLDMGGGATGAWAAQRPTVVQR